MPTRTRRPQTPTEQARRLRDAMTSALGTRGHALTWTKRKGKPEFAGQCQRCKGKVIAGVDAEGYDFLRYPPPALLRTKFLRSLARCLGRP